MIKYVDRNLSPVSTLNWVYAGVQYPANVFTNFSEAELEDIGIFTVHYEEVPTPEGKQVKDYEYEWEDGRVIATPIFEETPVVVPFSVSRAQGKASLLSFGLLDEVSSYIEAMPAGVDKTLALLAFDETNEWQRNSPFLQQMAVEIGLTEEQLDNLFIVAATITL